MFFSVLRQRAGRFLAPHDTKQTKLFLWKLHINPRFNRIFSTEKSAFSYDQAIYACVYKTLQYMISVHARYQASY